MTMLRGYAHLVDFFTSFDWWRLTPRNELVRGGAFCLAETGKLYAVYLPRPASVTLTLEPGNYHARWFNPRSGQWSDAPVASGPRWTPPAPADDGDWALLLRHDPQLRDTTPPTPASAAASLPRNEVLVAFTEAIDPRSVVAANFTLKPPVAVLAAKPGAEPNTVTLTTAALDRRHALHTDRARRAGPGADRTASPHRARHLRGARRDAAHRRSALQRRPRPGHGQHRHFRRRPSHGRAYAETTRLDHEHAARRRPQRAGFRQHARQPRGGVCR